MTRIKKIETPSKQILMDDLENEIEAKINSFICAMESYLKKNMEGLKGRWDKDATRKVS